MMLGELFDFYRAQFRVSLLNYAQYRVGVLIWFFARVVEPLIYIAVWSAVARAEGGLVGGFTMHEFAAYYIVLLVVNQMTFVWLLTRYDLRIRLGSLSGLLLRPAPIIHRDAADALAYRALTTLFIIPVAGVMALLFRPEFHTSFWAAALFPTALMLAGRNTQFRAALSAGNGRILDDAHISGR